MFLPLVIMYLILMFFILLSIAFLTLFERKLLGYVHLRKGPNKLLYKGFFQPMSDGMKLLLKEDVTFPHVNKILYFVFPHMSFILMLIYWFLYDFYGGSFFLLSILLFVLVSGMGVYSIMGMGWSSNSKYSLLGSYRSVAQTVSYEVGLIFIIISFIYMVKTYSLGSVMFYMSKIFFKFFLMMILFIIWFIIILAELNRAPFDFSESESELVSGFNVEYGSGKFVLTFLAEYGNIIFLCYMTMIIFFSNFLSFWLMLMLFLVVWVRGTFPRFRYDNLMYMNWKIFLPVLLLIVMEMVVLSVFLD